MIQIGLLKKLRHALLYALLLGIPINFIHLNLAQSIVISCGAVGNEFELCRTAAKNWSSKTGNPIEVLAAPNNSNERLSQYLLLLAAKAPDIDVFLIDATWPGILSQFLVDLKTDS